MPPVPLSRAALLKRCLIASALCCLFLALALACAYSLYEKGRTFVVWLTGDPVEELKSLAEKKENYQRLRILAEFYASLPFLSQEKKEEIERIKEEAKPSLFDKVRECVKGAITGVPEDMVSLTCSTISDFFLFGDIRDLLVEGWHWLTGQEVDPFVSILSGIGAVTTLLPEVDWEVAISKALVKLGAFTRHLKDSLISLWKRGEKEAVKGALKEVGTVGKAYKGYGLKPFKEVMEKVETPEELSRLSRLTQVEGVPRSYAAVMKSEGKVLKRDFSRILFVPHSPLLPLLKDLVAKEGWKVLFTHLPALLPLPIPFLLTMTVVFLLCVIISFRYTVKYIRWLWQERIPPKPQTP